MGLRVAMWSGPRTISTAMMRAWGSRADTFVADEPLYAHYLSATGLQHPVRERVIASQPTDWREVVAWLTGPVPGGRRVFFQKHMAHHLLPVVGRAWLDEVTNVFLIRDPAAMLVSLVRHMPHAGIEDTGLAQQVEIFRRVTQRTGCVPPVVDADDVLADPAALLSALCHAAGVAFDEAMLSWPPGRRPTDGVWADEWYGDVLQSTGFRPARERRGEVPDELRRLYETCLPFYEELHAHRLGA